MEWGTVAGWAAVVISALSALQSWRATRQAAQARDGAASVEVSLERIADALAARQRAPGRGGLRARREGDHEGEQEGAPEGGVPAFTVELLTRGGYRLRNVSFVPATRVTVAAPSGGAALAAEVELGPLASTEPFDLPPARRGGPTRLTVTCTEIPDGVEVALPGT